MPACADMGQYLLEMHQYTPQPTKHRSEDRAHNKGPGLCLDITNISLSSINSLHRFKSSPNANILDKSKYNAFADDKTNPAQMLKSDLERVENTVGEEENPDFIQCNPHKLIF